MDYIKRADQKIVLTEGKDFLLAKEASPSPEENILQAEAKKQLYERCVNLKAPYDEIALDYFYNELTAAEIADKTGKKLKTVQTQVYRARAKLKEKYLKGGIHYE